MKYLIEQKKLPSFTLTYLPDADASIHKHGPDDLKGIEKADQALQDILNSFKSWEDAIQEVTWIVLGDSGQSFINEDKKTSLIDLNNSMKNYTFWEGKKRNAQLAIAINERMAYIYVNDKQVELSEIMDILKKDERIGFIAWKDEQINYVVSPQSDEEFTFSPKGSYVDEFEQSWDIDGNASILDLKVQMEDALSIKIIQMPLQGYMEHFIHRKGVLLLWMPSLLMSSLKNIVMTMQEVARMVLFIK